MYPDMSTSLNVVSNALVFCAIFKFSAILRRIRDIGTRVSIRCPEIEVGAFLDVYYAVPPEDAAAGAFWGVTGGGGGGGAACFGGSAAFGGAWAGGAWAGGACAFGGGVAAAPDPAFASVSIT